MVVTTKQSRLVSLIDRVNLTDLPDILFRTKSVGADNCLSYHWVIRNVNGNKQTHLC